MEYSEMTEGKGERAIFVGVGNGNIILFFKWNIMRMFLTLGAKGFFEQVDFAGEDDMTPTRIFLSIACTAMGSLQHGGLKILQFFIYIFVVRVVKCKRS